MGGWRGLSLSAIAMAAATLAAGTPPARAEAWKDEKLGYSFSYPPRWDVVPVDSGGMLVARFHCNREYEVTNSRNWTRQRPWIEVLVIPFPSKEEPAAPPAKTDNDGRPVPPPPYAPPPPAKDLREYMERSFKERSREAFRFTGDEAATVNGLKVRRFEVAASSPEEGERRIYGWEFTAEDAYYGLVAEILAQEEKRLKSDLFQSFGTFRVFPRTGKLPVAGREEAAAPTAGPVDANREFTPEELRKRRDDATARALARIKENLPAGWTVSESRNFTAVSHADPKYTREVLAHAEALRAWLEQQFGYVGNGYAGRIIVRICSDNQEYSAFNETRRWSLDAPEVVTFKDREGWLDTNMEGLNRETARLWMKDKNDRLLWALPEWLNWGLLDFVERAKSKGGKLEFKADTWDSVEMKNLRRSQDLFTPKTFFTLPSGTLWVRQGASTQTQFFLNFLITGAASRSPRYRNLLSDYIKNLIFLLDSERPAAPEAGKAREKAPETEREWAEAIRKLQEQWREKEDETLQKLMDKTFAGWTDRDWDSFDALYRQDLK